MGWLALSTAGTLVILMVVVEVNSELWVEVKEQNEDNGTILQKPFRRYKREWVKFARPCREREDNSKRNPIATISSDFQKTQRITYHISGVGIDQPPYGIFVVNPRTGEINITSIVDREETPMFHINCQALDEMGRNVETPLVLTVKILDINDNAPVFSQSVFYGEIEENSAANTLVMVLNATDADEPNHLNSKIAFKIVSQEPAGQPMFLLNRHNGEVRSMTSTLDREKYSKYSLRVSGADLDGAGQATECGCQITIKDVNDNFPIFTESQYSVKIEENILSSEVSRFHVTDLDEEFTDNWFADYSFTSGNEGNWFVIETDAKTNEGILKVVKALDYEQFQTMKLVITVKNKAPFHHSVISQYKTQSIPVTVEVINVKEGIAFHPTSKTFTVQKGISYKKLINYALGVYAAIDEDTGKPASFVRYAMGRNDGGYLVIDSKTAQIKFVKNLDRDSPFIVNKTLTAEILAIDDNTGKTSTGTVTVRVPDFNENCPTVFADKQTVCRTSASVIVTAKPLPNQPDTRPFTFSLVEQPQGTPATWSITTINDTSANLRAQRALSSGTHPLSLIVTDREGISCEIPETLELQACDCDEKQVCFNRVPSPSIRPDDSNKQTGTPSVGLGPAGIGLLLLGLLMLLLAPLLLLFCDCGAGGLGGVGSGFVPVPDGSEGTIHQWGIEGAQPQDKEITNICVPPITANGTEFMENSEVCTNAYAAETIVEGTRGIELTTRLRAASGSGGTTGLGGAGYSGTMKTRHSTGGTVREYPEGGVNVTFLDTYFSQKAFACTEEDDSQGISDCLLIYDDEGVEPPSSPIGCCSFIADDFDESFLDSLGPKFKKLADISMGIDDETKLSQVPGKTNISTTEIPGSLSASAMSTNATCQPITNVTCQPTTDVTCQSTTNVTCQPTTNVTCQLAAGSTFYSNETSTLSASGSILQPAIPIPDPLLQGNFLMTESYTASSSFLQPSSVVFDPQLTENVTVTERVICPISGVSGIQGNLHGSAQLAGSCNVTCTEDPCSRLI
ncbi:desmoglein-3-like [Vombatus ursinus]|uniref:Cadherin domain-containing protein n=1 Tax=Vombatus ursinus TaxID=29139 RepID=A0A4X2K2Q2_VOMUR|nr:desmoglein-3-like [Vombatus ursinus]XP_027732796.1 desmoglein-3-like [Vombatus ursinus]